MAPAARKRAATKRAAASRGRGRPTAHDGERTRQAILASAIHRFGRAGPAGVSMETIAADCDINVRAIYYHFASKQVLLEAAADEAFRRYGGEVVRRVFAHADVRSRVRGYVEVHRALHAEDPDVLPFIGMFLVEAQGPADLDQHPSAPRDALRDFLGVVVDDAIARGEVSPDLDRDGALMLLGVIGMGLALGSLGEPGPYPAMLDALELLNEGNLFVDPA